MKLLFFAAPMASQAWLQNNPQVIGYVSVETYEMLRQIQEKANLPSMSQVVRGLLEFAAKEFVCSEISLLAAGEGESSLAHAVEPAIADSVPEWAIQMQQHLQQLQQELEELKAQQSTDVTPNSVTTASLDQPLLSGSSSQPTDSTPIQLSPASPKLKKSTSSSTPLIDQADGVGHSFTIEPAGEGHTVKLNLTNVQQAPAQSDQLLEQLFREGESSSSTQQTVKVGQRQENCVDAPAAFTAGVSEPAQLAPQQSRLALPAAGSVPSSATVETTQTTSQSYRDPLLNNSDNLTGSDQEAEAVDQKSEVIKRLRENPIGRVIGFISNSLNS